MRRHHAKLYECDGCGRELPSARLLACAHCCDSFCAACLAGRRCRESADGKHVDNATTITPEASSS